MSSCYNEYQNTVFNWQVVSPMLNPQLEFNRFASSFATLFEIVSLEGWVDLLNNVMASTGCTPKKPMQHHSMDFCGSFQFHQYCFHLDIVCICYH